MSVTDKAGGLATRNKNDARTRLRTAALALFGELGFEGTTAAAIAARAGVTERTFFRHFADKREVLFDGQRVLLAALTGAVAEAPARLGPLDTLFTAFGAVLPLLEANRAFAAPRQRVIAATPALAERELAKHAALADSLADALRARGVGEQPAELAARTGVVAFAYATMRWLEDPSVTLAARLDAVLRDVRALSSDG